MASLFGKVNCANCQEDINGVRVQCTVCPDFDICLQCFANGAEIGQHRNDHSYKFVDSNGANCFTGKGNWSGSEEIQMLESMDTSGFGNWENGTQNPKSRVTDDLFAKVSCTYCQEDINGVRVQCCVCTDFDICLQCFASGAEIGQHKNEHSYRFVDHYAVSIFGGKGSWTGREELQLLDAMETYGFGNWENISLHMKTRTAEEVRDEYTSRYLDGNIGKATWGAVQNSRPVLNDHIPEDKGPLSPEVTARLPPLDCSPEEARLLGYTSHRDDYEREYNMEAEKLVSSLHLNTREDSTIELALKLAQVDMYTRCLRERFRRKRVVKDYQLVAKFFASQRKDSTKKPMSKEQSDFREKMCVFSQFLTSGEHERLLASIERERELRHRLSELLRYRSLGLTTQEEIIHYEQHAAFQKQQQIKQNQAGSSGYTVSNPETPLKNGRREENPNFTERKSGWLQESEDQEMNTCDSSNNFDNIQPPPLTSLPHGSLLSQPEIQLCSTLNIEPVQYTTLKSLIIQDNLTNGERSRPEMDSSSNDATVKDVIAEYLNVSGWLPGVSVV